MTAGTTTAIVTGASQGIGAGIARAFLNRGYNIVASSCRMTESSEISPSDKVALADGDIGDIAAAQRITATAASRFGSIDVLINNAGIYFTKPFIEYTLEDLRSLLSTNIEGSFHITQLAVRQMLAQKRPAGVVTITAALAHNPIRNVTASMAMATKGALETATRHLAMEFSKDQIRFNAIAPGVVYTPLHRDTPPAAMEKLSPMGRPSTVGDIANAALYLAEAPTVTGTTIYVDGGSHLGRW